MPKGNSSSSQASKPTKSCRSEAPFFHREEEDGDGVLLNSSLRVDEKFFLICVSMLFITVLFLVL